MSLLLAALVLTSSANLMLFFPVQKAQSQIQGPNINTAESNNPPTLTNNLNNSAQASTLSIGGNGTIIPSAPTMVATTSTPPSLTPQQENEINATIAETLEYPQQLTQTANPSAPQAIPDPNSATIASPQPSSLDLNSSIAQLITNSNPNNGTGNYSSNNMANSMNSPAASTSNNTNTLALQQLSPLRLYASHTVSPIPSSFKHVLAEPSIAQKGNIVFFTGNIFAARSTTFGNSWQFINPFAGHPGAAGFCCDQVALYNPTYDIFVWYKQGRADATGENINQLKISKDALNWWSYNISPKSINSAWTHQWFDFPALSYSNNNLYLTTNTFDQSSHFKQSVTLRFNLNDLRSALPVHFQYFNESTQFNYTPVQGATNTMYLATHDSSALGNRERIYQWPDSGPLRVFSVPVPSWTFGARDMVCRAPDGTNWCGRADSRITGGWISTDITTGRPMIGFTWNAKQGGAFNYPYIDVATFFINNGNVVYRSSPIIWHPNFAWQYGFVTPKTDGSLGLIAFYGGGSFYPSIAAGIVDRSTGNPPPYQMITVRASNAASSLWGDYHTDRTFNGIGPIWVGASWTLQGCNTNACVEPLFFAFGR